MNDEKLKFLELKIKDLVSLRQLITQALVVLIGGVVGLFFIPESKLKYIVIAFGVFYVVVLGKNLYSTINKIDKLLYKKEMGSDYADA